MQVTAKLNNLRIAPRKVRLVAKSLRGKTAEQAQYLLHSVVKKSALPLAKLLHSAVANAKNTLHCDIDDLIIASLKVDEGRKLKRWRARARGRACRIEKKTSHITLVLKKIEKAADKKAEKEKNKLLNKNTGQKTDLEKNKNKNKI